MIRFPFTLFISWCEVARGREGRAIPYTHNDYIKTILYASHGNRRCSMVLESAIASERR